MSSPSPDYLDGYTAGGDLSKVFAIDVATVAGRRAACCTTQCFAEASLHMHGRGLVVRCCVCEHLLLRFVNVRVHMFLDVRGVTYLHLNAPRSQEAS